MIFGVRDKAAATKQYPYTALAIFATLNFFNYVDRSVLFAVQPLVQQEFRRSDAEFGFLTTAFFICYTATAPFIGVLADRFARKWIIVAGALVWSAATLLTAFTYDFTTLLIRHTIVGIGEATFVTIAPSFLADLFAEEKRGRVLAIFYLNLPLGTAVGYIIGGYLGGRFGWRSPFYVAALPGFLLALALTFLPEPRRGAKDRMAATHERATVLGLARNGAFWTATLGMAMMTFSLGGLQVWMPTFLYRIRGVPLDHANQVFGIMTAANAVIATLVGGWLGDRLLQRTAGAYYLISALSLGAGIPVMALAIFGAKPIMFPAIAVGEFLLLLNTAPLNAAIINSVSASVRATAIAINLFVIHLLGDAFSPTLIGYVSDKTNLQTGFIAAIIAVLFGSVVLFYGMRFAPQFPVENKAGASA